MYFTVHVQCIPLFINEKLEKATETERLIHLLELLKSIYNSYLQKLETFENDVHLLFKYGKITFLSDKNVSFCFHCICFYLPQLARKTFNNHQLGLGIFTMQGCNRRNKESKNTIN